jgi:NAD(P)-dependent dehydrogenase (short-subunit alcohol dehydrogenase family)
VSDVNFASVAHGAERESVGRWTEAAVPDQSGRVAVVTGGNTGIGFATARVLAEHGAHVVLACRDACKGEAAAARIADAAPNAEVAVAPLDLASLRSVRETSSELLSRYERIDLLINNAGVMEPPYTRTVDGFELTFATNHLGPFALTGLLLDRLLETPGSRIVTVSSEGHTRGAIDLDHLQFESGYRADSAYCQSKLANLLFAYELDRRLRAAGAGASSLACHPGIVLTHLYRTRSKLERILLSRRLRLLNFWLVQTTRMGALPTLRAATDPAAEGGEFYGPPGRGYVGYPVRAKSAPRSHDGTVGRRLWQESERLTSVRYPV